MISNQATDAVWNIDLGPIKAKLMHIEAGEGWSRQRADMVEVEYRRFLHLMKVYPNEQLAPSVDTDTFWHYHILDTMKYAVDCETVFGYFLHHFPYLGLRGEDDEEVLMQCGDRMRALYESTFGDSYLRPAGADTDGVATQTVELDSEAVETDCAALAKPAYCAAPAKPGNAANRGISATPAYCAAPATRADKAANNSAYCAAPATTAAGLLKQAAYCAAPARPAYCAAPAKPAATTAHKPAYCASPAKPAYCAAPARPTAATATKPAYCAAPASAYCAAPALPVVRACAIHVKQDRPANNAAYCAAPAVPFAVIEKSFGKNLLAVAA